MNVAPGERRRTAALDVARYREYSPYRYAVENLPFRRSSLALRRDEDVVAELIRLKRELAEANRRQSRFLSNITHEFRSPLSAILGLADLLRDERVRHGRAPQPELDYITQAAGQLWILVNNLLDIARADGPSVASPAPPGGPLEGPAPQPDPLMGNAVLGVTRSETRSCQEARANGAPRMRVLIIDDDPATRFLLSCCLPQTDFDVTEASDGEEGLASAAANPPDIVILDLLMPGMPGGDVLAALRAGSATHAIPVVVATAGDLAAGTIRALRLDAAAIISKSELTPDTLPRTLRAAAGRTP